MNSRFTIPHARLLIGVLFFLSGFSALIYEVLWVRMLTLVFGNTAQAAAAVLAVLFAGFAIGAFLGGRLADVAVQRLTKDSSSDAAAEWARPLLLQIYAFLELGIGLYALATPFIVKFGEVVFVWLCRGVEEPGLGLTMLKVVMSAIGLVLPSGLMGATLPILAKCTSESIEKAGARVGMLYSMNTWGGVAGGFAAGFVLIPFLGVIWTLILAALLNAGIAAVGFHLAGRPNWMSTLSEAGASPTSRARSAPLAPPPGLAPFSQRLEEAIASEGTRAWLLAIVAVSGFTSLAYEVLWTRTFVIVFGADIYAFTAVLTTFLAGIAVGSLWAARLLERHTARGVALVGAGILAIALLQVGIGLVTAFLLPTFDKLPYVLFKSRHWLGSSWLGTTLLRFVLTFFLMIIPTAMLGATFPLAVRLYASSLRTLGREVGELYAANTVAAIVGSLAAGFLFMPWLGAEWGLRLFALCNMALGGFLLAAPLGAHEPGGGLLNVRYLARVGVVAVGLVIVTMCGWNRKLVALSQSRVWAQTATSFTEFKRFIEGFELPFYSDGVCATVGVAQAPRMRTLTINGKPVASTSFSDLMIERMLGLLPTALSLEPKRALVIGLGTGVTLSGVSLRPGLKVDCVEISSEVVEAAARWFADVNHEVLKNRNVRVVVNDARQFLLLTDKQYDLITSDPIHPWAAGSVSLYTKEFYRLCHARLRGGGVMCQWLPMYQLSDGDMKSVLKTFASVFPHVMVWACMADMLVIGSNEPIQIELRDFERFFAQEQVAKDLADVNMRSAFDVFGCFVMDEVGLPKLTQGLNSVTDDRPSLEFTTPRYVNRPIHCAILKEMLQFRSASVERLLSRITFDTGVSGRDAQRRLRHTLDRATKRFALQASRMGQNFVIGFTNLWVGHLPEALALFDAALATHPNDPELRHYLGVTYALLGEPEKARRQFTEAVKLDPERDETYIQLAMLALEAGQLEEAYAAARKASELNPWASRPHTILGTIYLRQKLLVKAEEEFLLALAADPRDSVAKECLVQLKLKTEQLRREEPRPPVPEGKERPSKSPR